MWGLQVNGRVPGGAGQARFLNISGDNHSKCVKVLNVRKSRPKCQRVALAAGLWLAASFPLQAESAALDVARRLNEAFIAVAEKVSPAVVVIEVAERPGFKDEEDGDDSPLDQLPPDLRRRLEEHAEKYRQNRSPSHPPVYSSRGSGIVIRPDGWILTNDHVVDGAQRVRVKFRDGTVYEAVEGKWFTDPQSDLAVIQIAAQGLPTAKMADSTKTRVGEFAIAIGAPFELDYSVTYGHVSAKGRSHVVPSYSSDSPGASMDQDFIQTDASINPGNSGGPLINIEGEVMGVNTLVHGLNRGIGFAIPSNLAREVADQLIADGKFTRAWLGVSINPLQEDQAFRELLPEIAKGLDHGVIVKSIVPAGPAAKSALKPADVIVAVDGVPVASAQQLRNAIRSRKIGTTVTLDVVRSDRARKRQELQVKLQTEEWRSETASVVRLPKKEAPVAPVGIGLTVQTLTRALAEKFGATVAQGVVVTAVERDSAAARAGIRNGDIITEIDRQPVANPKQFRDAIKSGGGQGLLVHLVSDGSPEYRILKDGGD